MRILSHFIFLLLVSASINLHAAAPLTQAEADLIIAEAVLALTTPYPTAAGNTEIDNNQSPFQYDEAYWEKAIDLIFEHPELADQILAALEAEKGLKKAVTKEIKWREFICSHNKYQLHFLNLMQYQNTLLRITQHSFREKGQHTIHDTLQTGCNRDIYEGDNPAITRIHPRLQPPTPPSGS